MTNDDTVSIAVGHGVAASPAAEWLGAEADRAGRVITEENLSIAGSPNVFVIGDTAAVKDMEGNPVPRELRRLRNSRGAMLPAWSDHE